MPDGVRKTPTRRTGDYPTTGRPLLQRAGRHRVEAAQASSSRCRQRTTPRLGNPGLIDPGLHQGEDSVIPSTVACRSFDSPHSRCFWMVAWRRRLPPLLPNGSSRTTEEDDGDPLVRRQCFSSASGKSGSTVAPGGTVPAGTTPSTGTAPCLFPGGFDGLDTESRSVDDLDPIPVPPAGKGCPGGGIATHLGQRRAMRVRRSSGAAVSANASSASVTCSWTATPPSPRTVSTYKDRTARPARRAGVVVLRTCSAIISNSLQSARVVRAPCIRFDARPLYAARRTLHARSTFRPPELTARALTQSGAVH